MHSSRIVLGLVMVACACSHRAAQTFHFAGPVQVWSPFEPGRGCVERLLLRSRYTGYIEQTVDKQMSFFRVYARNQRYQPKLDKKGRPLPVQVPKGKSPAFVQFYNVQCTAPEAAIITPMNATGPLDDQYVMDAAQFDELQRYGLNLGATAQPAVPPQLAPTPLPAADVRLPPPPPPP